MRLKPMRLKANTEAYLGIQIDREKQCAKRQIRRESGGGNRIAEITRIGKLAGKAMNEAVVLIEISKTGRKYEKAKGS